MTYSNVTLVIDRIHRMLGEQALQIRPWSTVSTTTTTSNELFNSQTCMAFGRLPSSPSPLSYISTFISSLFVYHHPHSPNLETQWQWCFYPITMTSSPSLSLSISLMSQPNIPSEEGNKTYTINDEDTGDDTRAWPTLDEMADIIGYGLLVAFYYIGCAYLVLFFIVMPYIICTRLYQLAVELFRRGDTQPDHEQTSNRTTNSTAQVRWVSMPPPRVTTYRVIRINQGYGSTDKTVDPLLVPSVNSEEDDNMPLGLRYPNHRINHLSVSAPASASTQHLESSLPSSDVLYSISRLPYQDTSTSNIRRSNGDEDEKEDEERIMESTDSETIWAIDSTECPICLEKFVYTDIVMILGCQHTFHVRCINRWLHRRRPTCPMCRAPVPTHRTNLNLLDPASSTTTTRLTDNIHYRMSRDPPPPLSSSSRRVHRLPNDEGNEGERRPLLFNR
jgi:hypothetical protein